MVEEHACLFLSKYIFNTQERLQDMCSENGTEFQVFRAVLKSTHIGQES